jgi:glucose/arabinose dehydrogenase
MNAVRSDFFRRGGPLLRVVVLLMLALLCAPAAMAAPPADFQTSLVVGDGLNGPSGFEIAPGRADLIPERSGKITIVKNGQLLGTPFADLPSEDTGDRGLIGIAFDPDFGVSNHWVYLYYTGHDLLNHLSTTSRWSTSGPSATRSTAWTRLCKAAHHELRVEYFEGGGGARAEFSYDRIGEVVPTDGG